MKTVMVTEANQQFSKLIQEVERDGISIRILRRNRPVAVLMPEGKQTSLNKERAMAIADMKQLLKKGQQLGTEGFRRDELYDRS